MATSGSFSACGFVLCHNRFKIKIYILTKCKSNLFREIKTISASFLSLPCLRATPAKSSRRHPGSKKPRAAEYSRKIKYLWERKNNLMHLHKLSLIDFKNIAEAHIELSPQINCLVGDNGTGKTNLLDAVHYLSVGKADSILPIRSAYATVRTHF